MALFRQSSDKSAGKERDAAITNRDRLAVRLSEAQAAVLTSTNAAQRAALDGDDGGLDAAEHAEGAALRRLSTIVAAHTEAEQILVMLDRQIAATLDKKTRVATAAETNALAAELSEASASFDIAVTTLANASTRAALICFEATGLASFSASSKIEVPAAVEVISALLREHAKMVLNGMAAATLPQPDVPVVPVKIVPPTTKRIFSMKAVKWTVDGNLRYAPKYAQVDLPPAVADRALTIGACVTMDSDACRMFNGTHVAGSGNPEDNVSLDEAGDITALASSHEPPIQFQRVDRGATYQVRTAGGRS